MSGDAGTASTTMLSSSETISGTKPISTSRLAVARPCSSATELEVTTSSRKAKMPASTAERARAPTCLLPSTPAMHTMPP